MSCTSEYSIHLVHDMFFFFCIVYQNMHYEAIRFAVSSPSPCCWRCISTLSHDGLTLRLAAKCTKDGNRSPLTQSLNFACICTISNASCYEDLRSPLCTMTHRSLCCSSCLMYYILVFHFLSCLLTNVFTKNRFYSCFETCGCRGGTLTVLSCTD